MNQTVIRQEKKNEKRPSGPKLNFKSGCIELTHGSGGRASMQLIEQLFQRYFANPWLLQGNDQARVTLPSQRMVMTTDAHVISPLFFPGGNIGSLAVHGTVNDIAMAGATPLYLSASFILEEGFRLRDLKTIVGSMAEAAGYAKVSVVTGDTKVVERGKGDGVFITTTGVGVVPEAIHISGDQARPGDKILVSGSMGDHGIAVMAQRQNFEVGCLHSDSAPLNHLVQTMLDTGAEIHCLRDPTRGGIATTLNELAQQSGVGCLIDEACIPVRQEVQGACELLGLDPLYIANEGKLVAICKSSDANMLLEAMQAHPLGKHAAIIGEVIEDSRHWVQLTTRLGGKRLLDWLVGEQLPRIC